MLKPDVDLAALRTLVARVYGRQRVEITRAGAGGSTQVYRLQTEKFVHYLRVAEDEPDRYGVELLVHERLLSLGVRVPAIVHYEPFDPALDRSLLITTEIPGHPIAGLKESGIVPAVFRAAGQDLAMINTIPVAGFGFVERSDPFPTRLSADFPNALAFIEADLAPDMDSLRSDLPQSVTDEIGRTVQEWTSQLRAQSGRLAHGDFDGPHIYVDATGYSGVIDFGEIRGADALYDLGHFAMLTSEWFPEPAIDSLLEGYCEVTHLSVEDLRRMWLWAALIGVRFLARTRGRTSVELRQTIADRVAHALREQAR